METIFTRKRLNNIVTCEKEKVVIKIDTNEPRNLSVEETKLATERLAKEQIAVTAVNEKIMEGYLHSVCWVKSVHILHNFV